jgi:hypothetical protein
MDLASRGPRLLLLSALFSLPCACKSALHVRDGSTAGAGRDGFSLDEPPGGAPCCATSLRGIFSPSQGMTKPRVTHTATLLGDGRILIAGGEDANDRTHEVGSAELFDPVAVSFTATGSMNEPRLTATASRLMDGKVLVAGGSDGIEGDTQAGVRAELYDASTGTFSPTGSMQVGQRIEHTATLLAGGSVLIVGGLPFILSGVSGYLQAELYDAGTGGFVIAGNTTVVRTQHTATLLADGRVLIVGGIDGNGTYTSAELYDPVTSTFTSTGSMSAARQSHAAAKLQDGTVLVVGGWNLELGALASAELYDAATGGFTPTGSMSSGRVSPTATLLCDGRVLVTGGNDSNRKSLASAELYDPTTGTFSFAGSMLSARSGHTATRLCDGRVLIAGGATDNTLLATAELFE